MERASPGGALVTEYRTKVHLFRAQVAKVRNDFSSEQWPEFESLCEILSTLNEYRMQRDGPNNGPGVIAKAIDNVIHFVHLTM